MKMDVATDIDVECADGPCGRSQYVILDPVNGTITHIVVGETDTFAKTRLVPLTYVADSAPERMRLKCTRAELQALPLFSEYEHIGPVESYLTYLPPEFWMGPLTAYWPTLRLNERRYVPSGELSIRRGARVEAIDGHVGSVDEFLTEPGSGHITHLVLREGHLWGRRDVVIPISQIDRIEQDTVYLRIDKDRAGALPQFSPARWQEGMADASRTQAEDLKEDASDGSQSIQALVADLSCDNRTTRVNARLALVKIGAPAVDELAAALASANTQVRWEAAKALQQINDPAGAAALVAALEDPDSGVRWIAAEGLSLVGRPGLVPLLEALSARPDSPWLRNGAHHVLRALTDPELQKTVAPVLAALQEMQPALEVPVAAHEALVALGAVA